MINKLLKLNNGLNIPVLGLGTYKVSNMILYLFIKFWYVLEYIQYWMVFTVKFTIFCNAKSLPL